MFESHITLLGVRWGHWQCTKTVEAYLGLKADTGTEDVRHCRTLFGKRVDDRSAGRSKRGLGRLAKILLVLRRKPYLKHVTKDAENAVEASILGVGSLSSMSLPLDAGHHFSYQDQINDERRSQERILANVEDADRLVTTKEDLGVVLIKSTLVIADCGHVLDDDSVVGVLAFLVQDSVGSNHIIDNVRLGNLLRTELLLRAEVLAIIVAEVVVAGNGGKLDACIDEEVNKSRLHLRLAGFEVITTNEGVVLLSKLNGTRDEGILRRAVDERNILQNTGNGEHGRGSHFLVAILDSLQEIVGSVVNAGQDIGKALGIGSPLNDDLVETVCSLEVIDVLADLLDVLHGSLGAWDKVVGAIFLVRSDKVRVVDAGERLDLGHLLADQRLQRRLEDFGTVHGLGQVQTANVPTTNDEIVGVDHGHEVMEGDVDILARLAVDTELGRGSHDDGTIVIGTALALLSLPLKATTVGQNTRSDSCTVVATQTDQHNTELGNVAVDLEVVEGLLGHGHILTFGILRDSRGAVGVLGLDGLVGVFNIGGIDDKEILGSSRSRNPTSTVRRTELLFGVRSHFVLMDRICV